VVREYHPVAKQVDINISKSRAAVLSARGQFDPELAMYSAQKSFDGINYYNSAEPVITVPTWYGIEVYTGLNYFNGERLDPTDTKGRSSFAGVSVPLAKNLLMDKRRAALKTAKIFKELSETEKRTILNDLTLEAMMAYWHWVKKYRLYKIAQDAVIVNEKRFGLVKSAYQFGERPAIDTIETLAQLQSFRYLENEGLMQFKNATLQLSLYLWTASEEPYILSPEIIPAEEALTQNMDEITSASLEEALIAAELNHPEIREYDFKLRALNVNRKLKFQELLPYLNVSYNQLGKGYDIFKTATAEPAKNYRFGLSFSVPLRFSEGRGEFKIAKLKITETRLQQAFTKNKIINKVKEVFNELLFLKQQIAIQQSAYNNYVVLQKGEELRFLNGESSLFLINSRENKTLEALQKLVELQVKYSETFIKLQWASGSL
jgi:outer membrane protein TolC